MLYINKKSFWFSTTNISRKCDTLSNMHLMIKVAILCLNFNLSGRRQKQKSNKFHSRNPVFGFYFS